MNELAVNSVVVCADDYALNAPVSQGIVALAVLGRLSATSVMVLSPRWREDAASLREMRGRLDVGLHLDWTSAFAQRDGFGQSLGVIMSRAALRLASKKCIQIQIERQLDAFEQHWDAPPDHVDGHQHIQQFPVWRDALMDVLDKRYGASERKPWLRISRVAQPGLKARIITRMGADELALLAQAAFWPAVAPLLGAYDFDGSLSDYAQRMKTWLQQLPAQEAPSLLMCHPALSAQADDAIGPARAREFAYLAGTDFVQHLIDANARLVRPSGLPITHF